MPAPTSRDDRGRAYSEPRQRKPGTCPTSLAVGCWCTPVTASYHHLSSTIKPARPIATERLVLEPLRVEHAEEMAGLLSDDRLHEFIGGAPLTRDGLRRQFARQATGRSADGTERWLNWILRRRGDHVTVGYVQATVSGANSGQTAALAWVVGVAFQGQGYAREGVASAMQALGAGGVRSFTASIHPEHLASIAVARRLGFNPTAERIEGETVWTTGLD